MKASTIHTENWIEIVKVLKDHRYDDIHKFYSEKDGWGFLTDKYGYRNEIGIGDSVGKILGLINEIRKTNQYTPQGRRAYRFRTTAPCKL